MAKYKLGKMFLNGDGVEKDIPKAVEWLKQAALEENEFAEYALGRIYLFGLGVEKDLPLAMEYLRSAAAKGNECAAELLRQKELFDKQSISLCISRLFKYLCGVLQEKAEAEFSAKIMRTDKKLRRRIAEKKQAQGLKLE